MRLMLKQKIGGLAILSVVVSILVVMITILVQKGIVDRQVGEEVDELGRANLQSIAQDVYNMVHGIDLMVHDNVTRNMNVADMMLENYGGASFGNSTAQWTAINQFTHQSQTITLPRMLVGNRWLGQNREMNTTTHFVDDVVEQVGGTVTVFQRMNDAGDMLRVATNVEKLDGTRAIGTYIPARNPDGSQNVVIRTVLSGETYVGRAYVVNAWYSTSYKPIIDRRGNVVGVLYVGVKQESIEELREMIMDIPVGATGYVFVLGGSGSQQGQYIISDNGTRDGENIWEARDADGNLFIQDLINNALALNGDDITFAYYPWQNEGDRVPRMKIVAVAYYEPWDWVIGAGTYMDDFYTARESVANAINSMVMMAILFGIIILAVAGTFAFVVAKKIADPIARITDIAGEIAKGDLRQEVDIVAQDEVGLLANAFRDMTESLREKAEAADQIARGNMNVAITVASRDDMLGNAMTSMKENLTTMLSDLEQTIVKQKAGDLDAMCSPGKLQGAYADLLNGVNEALLSVIDPLREVSTILSEYSDGDMTHQMRQLPGKQIILTESLNNIRENLKKLIAEGVRLSESARDGRLSDRGDASKFKGGYKQIIEGMNQIIVNIMEPINETVGCLSQMAEGDLSTLVTGDYKGDHAIMKTAMNSTLDSLNELLSQVAMAVNQVRSGAKQVSDSSQSLSQGATEQASSLEEVSSSLTEVGSQTKQNAENAQQANQLSTEVRNGADEGNTQMNNMLNAMTEINRSSGEISRIIKVIDEIAFQTNLLALNAAVEAARAGVHGKGFAVVAEEVRNLAQRSAKAAKETTDLIEGSIQKVANGTQIANQTADALTSIVSGVTKVSDLIEEINSASQEQSLAIDQVNEALQQIDTVTQSNSANAEEGAAASEELSGQAEGLNSMLAKFRLRSNIRNSEHGTALPGKTSRKRKSLESGDDFGFPRGEKGKNQVIRPEDEINLDDDNFGGF